MEFVQAVTRCRTCVTGAPLPMAVRRRPRLQKAATASWRNPTMVKSPEKPPSLEERQGDERPPGGGAVVRRLPFSGDSSTLGSALASFQH